MTKLISFRGAFVATFLFASASIQLSAAATSKKESIESGGRKRVIYVYAPDRLSAESPAPVLMLFHGSGRDGISQIKEWKKLADSEGVLLVAPDAVDRRHWVIPDDGPEFLRDIVAFLQSKYVIDTRRIYAFGHSAGASFALRMAPLESNFLAAVAVHAGAFTGPGDTGILPFAERKIPVWIVVGTKDPFFSLEVVRQTQAAFVAAGFPAEVREIPDHDHNYYSRSSEINAMAWAFLSSRHLDTDARYNAYRIENVAGAVSITQVESP